VKSKNNYKIESKRVAFFAKLDYNADKRLEREEGEPV
jgi:hypothetical protein